MLSQEKPASRMPPPLSGDDYIRLQLEQTIEDAAYRLVRSQRSDGAWHECFETGVMPDSHMAICLALLKLDAPQWIERLIERIVSTQGENGSWPLYPGHSGDLSTTVECCYAMLLHGGMRRYPERIQAAERYILAHGGLRKCRNLTKVLLAVGGEIAWTELPSPWLYSFLFHPRSPVTIADIVMFTRLHIASIIVLSAFRYVESPNQPLLLAHLVVGRKGGTGRPFPDGSAKSPPRRLEGIGRLKVFRGNIARGIEFLLANKEDDGSVGGYHSSTVLLVFMLRALGCSKSHPVIKAALAGIERNFIARPHQQFLHQQTCDAHVWNTALAAKALQAAGYSAEHPVIRQAIRYLLRKQQSVPFGAGRSGGWGFSSNNTKHPDNDDTVACLDVLFPFRHLYRNEWKAGLDYLLGMQNKDGGWSAFDHNRGKAWLEHIPANDMNKAMSDPSTPDITGRVVEFLAKRRITAANDTVLRCALVWLHARQERDGSWCGRWGTAYLYGTWCVIKGMAAAGDSRSTACLRRAGDWLLRIQQADGGFGECCSSDEKNRYIPHPSIATHTAWGLDALLSLYDREMEANKRKELAAASKRSAIWLLQQGNEGEWGEAMPTGCAFPGALYIRYHIYPKVWPLLALTHYRSSLAPVMKGGEPDGSRIAECFSE